MLIRDPSEASTRNYDLVIIGGGIHGVMIVLEAVCRGLSPLLIERKDFGSATSFNSSRIIHGGFRYLQSLNFSRLKNSSRERQWFLKNFPDLVKPLPCLVPLYGDGLRRASTMRIASVLYELLTKNRNDGIHPERQIPPGRLISASEVKKIFPQVNTRGLQGGAVWYDGFVEDSQRLIVEVLRMACRSGATVVNYLDARELLKENNKVVGVTAIDRETGEEYLFRSNVVINAAGPWCAQLAERFDRKEPDLFRSMLAWNILFDRTSPSNHGLAVRSERGGHTYFLVPWKGRLLAGTGHAPWHHKSRKPLPSQDQIRGFTEDINRAIPGLHLRCSEISYVLAGLQSATRPGGKTLATREVFVDHSHRNGPSGLYSISGVKFTTARLVAEKVLGRIFGKTTKTVHSAEDKPRQLVSPENWRYTYDQLPAEKDWKKILQLLCNEESVVHLDDLFFRRTTLWENPGKARKLAPNICRFLGWEQNRSTEEVERLSRLIDGKLTRQI